MPTYYEILGVNSYATQAEITAAFNNRMQQLEPKTEAETKKLQEAYAALGNENERVAYDIDSSGFDAYMQRFKAQGVKVTALERPYELNHYEYINKLYGFREEDKLTPLQEICYDNLWEKLSYASTMLGHEKNAVNAELDALNSRKEKNKKLERRLKILEENINKVEIVQYVLLLPDVKRLYDLTLDIHDGTKELSEVERLISKVEQEDGNKNLLGGRKVLAEWFKKYPKLNFGPSLFILQKKNLLSPKNIDALLQHEEIGDILHYTFNNLLETNLINQHTFVSVIEYSLYALEVAKGIGALNVGKVATFKTFMDMIHAKKDAYHVGMAFRTLNEDGILTSENYAAILKRPPQTANHIHLFNDMWDRKEFIQEDKEALMWTGEGKVKLLSHRINQMFAHGLTLVDIDVVKGKGVIELAFKLKRSLKSFFAKPLSEQYKLKEAFKNDFIQLLHSKDEEMAATQYKQRWKIIIKNILIALTGIGLFAIGINYLVTNRLFFSQTQRERNVIAVEEGFELNC